MTLLTIPADEWETVQKNVMTAPGQTGLVAWRKRNVRANVTCPLVTVIFNGHFMVLVKCQEEYEIYMLAKKLRPVF